MYTERMGKTARTGLYILMLLALVSNAWAAEFFVSKSGSNSNPGTSSQPWLTIQKAADTMVAGDTVLVAPGTYNERVETTRNGSPGNRIHFKAIETKSVTMNGFELDHDYIALEGFCMTGSSVSQYQGYVTVSSNTSNCIIMRCKIFNGANKVFGIRFHSGSSECAFMENELDGVDWIPVNFHGSNHLVAGNIIVNCPGWDAVRFFGTGHVFRNNHLQNINKTGSNHTDLFQTFGVNGDECRDILVEGNFALNCDAQIGNFEDNGQDIRNFVFRNNLFINIASTANMFCENMEWYNNTFYNCSTRNNNAVLSFATSTDKGTANYGICMNNMFIGCGGTHDATNGWYSIETGVSNCQTDYNFVAQKNGSPKTGFSEPNGINGGNPEFKNIGAFDFHIPSSSPAVGRGVTVSGFNNDKDGKVRSSLWDIGAYEFVPDMPENMGMEY